MTTDTLTEDRRGPAGGSLRLRRCIRGLALPGRPESPVPLVTEEDLAPLPAVVQRYLRAREVVGRPRTWSFRVRFTGQFRLGRDKPWMPCAAWQYNTALGPGRAYAMRIMMAGVIPMLGTDTYAHGRGAMKGKVLGIVPVADGTGPEFDLGELTTYVNDAIGLAPSMLLVPATTWTGVDHSTFDVTFQDRGLTSTSRVTVDERGLPVLVVSEDRFCDLPSGMVRAPWHTPLESWERHAGRWFPGPGRAVWQLPDGELEYAHGRFQAGSFAENLPA